MQNVSVSPGTMNNNVITMDDVELSSEHISSPIDIKHYDSPLIPAARRQQPTSVAAFPCQKGIDANCYPTFPLIFQTETRRKFDDYENISLYNLWCDLKRRLQHLDSENRHNNHTLKSMAYMKCYDNSTYFENEEKFKRAGCGKSEILFPLKLNAAKCQVNKNFPCFLRDTEVMSSNEKVNKNLKFPLQLKPDKAKFPYCLLRPEPRKKVTNKMQMHVEYLHMKNLEDIFKVFHISTVTKKDIQMHNFPLNRTQKSQVDAKFPCKAKTETEINLDRVKPAAIKTASIEEKPKNNLKNFKAPLQLRSNVENVSPKMLTSPVTINLGFSFVDATETENAATASSVTKPNLQTSRKLEMLQFPLKLKTENIKSLNFPQMSENLKNGTSNHHKSFQYLKTSSHSKDNLESLRKSSSKSLKEFSMTSFPLKNKPLSKMTIKFPCLRDNETNWENFKQREKSKTNKDKLSTSNSSKPENQTFPRKLQHFKKGTKQFPLEYKTEKETKYFPLKYKTEKATFQRIIVHKDWAGKNQENTQQLMKAINVPPSHLELSKFPFKYQLRLSKQTTTFPCVAENDELNFKQPQILKTFRPPSSAKPEMQKFPAQMKQNLTKFPFISKHDKSFNKSEQCSETLNISNSLQNKQSSLKLLSSITSKQPALEKQMMLFIKSLKDQQYITKTLRSTRPKEFPLDKHFVKQSNTTRFPLLYDELPFKYLQKSQVNIQTFPLTLKRATNKFPFINCQPEVMLNLSVQEIRLQFKLNKIANSLQTVINSLGITHNRKAITKFPLQERLIKKFYRKFPLEAGISITHRHAWPMVKHAISIHFAEIKVKISENSLNANKLKNVNISGRTILPSMTQSNLQKQQRLYCQKSRNDNEQHASSQVQFATEQVHVKNPAEAMVAVTSSSTSPQTNDDLTILPARNTKNMIMPTTTTASSEVGQYSAHFEHIQQNAIINIRDERQSSSVLLANIRNSSPHHRPYIHDDDADADDEGELEEQGAWRHERATLRASTPPMSTTTTTSVQNAERIRAAQQQVPYDDYDLGDLCNPQVAQTVECSDVRDTFAITVHNDGEISGNCSSSTGSFLAKNEPSSTSTFTAPTTPFVSKTSSSPTQSLSPAPSPSPISAAPYSHSSVIKCRRTSLENCPYCSELLPKYSALELCDFCGNACNRSQIDESKTGVTPQSYPSADSQITCVIPETEIQNVNAFLSEIAVTDRDLTDVRENIEHLKNTNEIVLDIQQNEEMKFEMRSAKGALPSSGGGGGGATSTTSAANARTAAKYSDTATPTHKSFARSKPTATSSSSVRNASDRTYTPSSLSAGTTARRLSNDSTESGRSTPTSRYVSDSPRSTTSRRLSSDSTGSTKSISGRSTPTSRYLNDSPTINPTSANRLSSSLRYANDPTTTSAYALPTSTNRNSTPSLGSLRNTTSTSLLSVDLPRYMPSTEAVKDSTPSSINRALSLDTAARDVLPERTRLRRQRRLRPHDSLEEEEDAVQRLNRLKARITASLSEVKSVLKQYSTDVEGENDTQTSNTLAPPGPSYVKAKPEENEDGPVTFRFVKKVRRRSFFSEDEEDDQKKGADETDKSTSGKTEQSSKLPEEAKQIPNDITKSKIQSEGEIKRKQNETVTQENNLGNSENYRVTNHEVSPKPISSTVTMPTIKIEDHEKISRDLSQNAITNQENEIKTKPTEAEIKNVRPKLNSTESDDLKMSPKAVGNNIATNNLKIENRTEVQENNNASDIKQNDRKSFGNTTTKISQKQETKVDKQVNDENKKHIKKGQNIKTKNEKSESKIPQRIGSKGTERTEAIINVNINKSKTEDVNVNLTKIDNEEIKNIKEVKIDSERGITSPKPIGIPKTESHGMTKEISPQQTASGKKNNTQEAEAQAKHLQIKEVSPHPTALVIKANIEEAKDQAKHLSSKEVSPKPAIPESNQQIIVTDNKITQLELKTTKPATKEASPKPSVANTKLEHQQPKSNEEISSKAVTSKTAVEKLEIKESKKPVNKEISMEPPVEENKSLTNNLEETSPKSSTTLVNEVAQCSHTPLIKIEGTAKPLKADSDLIEKDAIQETPPKTKKKVLIKTKEPASRRASLAAVEGSKIEPPLKLATPATIHRRPSDSEAIVKKKLITTKTTTSGAIAEVTPKPKIVKVKRSSPKKPLGDSDNKTPANDIRHLATKQSETIPTDKNTNKTDKQPSHIAIPASEANKSIQGDKNKDVTMPNDKMPSSHDTIGRKLDRILPTQLVIDEAAKSPSSSSSSSSPSSSSLTSKTIEITDTIDRATNNRTTATKKFESSEFENAGAAMLANVKTPLVSSTTASEPNGPTTKQTTVVAPADLHDLLQQEAVIVKPPVTLTHNELKVDVSQQAAEVIHNKLRPNEKVEAINATENRATPLKLEASIQQIAEPLVTVVQQQQVVQKTDVVVVKSNEVDGNAIVLATASSKEPSISVDIAKATTTTASAPVNNSSSSKEHSTLTVTKAQQQQQEQKSSTTTTTTTPTLSDEATTKTNCSPQISISRQQVIAEDTALKAAATLQPSTTAPTTTTTPATKEHETTDKMPELKVTPAPVQTAAIPHEPGDQFKKKVVIKKIIRQTSIEKAKKAEVEKAKKVEPEQTTTTDTTSAHAEEQPQDKQDVDLQTEVDQKEDNASANEECSETTEISEESSSQSEAAAAAALPDKPKKVRKIKKKVIIKRQKRRLSISDSFFNNTSSIDEVLPAEVETLEKPISYVSDDEDNDKNDAAEEVVVEKKPLKSCINKKEYNIGDEVLYAERFRRTQIRWKRGRVKEQITSISYLIDIDGTDVSSHINYLKKYTGRKVNFGGKEYLEIDYEQLAEEEERAERVQRRSYSIWNMV